MSKLAVITGVNGQDGSYLSELLLDKEYEVVGVVRRTSVDNLKERLSHLITNKNFIVVEGDITDPTSMSEIIEEYQPHEFYNLAAQSHVATSFKQPSSTWEINALGVQNILECIRKKSRSTKFYQASTSEMFGSVIDPDNYQRETTELSPNSPYAISKVAAHHTVRLYRDAYNIFACSGILFNHESPRRGEKFVTRKIAKYVGSFINPYRIYESTMSDKVKFADFALSMVDKLHLGNIKAYRDWGFAGDYVKAMWLMLQHDNPDDYVVATGEAHSVEDYLKCAFKFANIDEWDRFIDIDPSFIRPHEVPYLRGDASKAREILGWKPEVNFEQLVEMMVKYEQNQRIL